MSAFRYQRNVTHLRGKLSNYKELVGIEVGANSSLVGINSGALSVYGGHEEKKLEVLLILSFQ